MLLYYQQIHISWMPVWNLCFVHAKVILAIRWDTPIFKIQAIFSSYPRRLWLSCFLHFPRFQVLMSSFFSPSLSQSNRNCKNKNCASPIHDVVPFGHKAHNFESRRRAKYFVCIKYVGQDLLFLTSLIRENGKIIRTLFFDRLCNQP